jgi:hypothetical protein
LREERAQGRDSGRSHTVRPELAGSAPAGGAELLSQPLLGVELRKRLARAVVYEVVFACLQEALAGVVRRRHR